MNAPHSRSELARLLDYANLAVDAREADIHLLCLEAQRLGITRVLVNPVNVALAAHCLEGSEVSVGAAIAYPIGAYPAEIKRIEIEDAIENGAGEIVMMMAVGVFIEGLYDDTRAEMEVLVQAAGGRPTALMIEAGALTHAQQVRACRMAIEAGINHLVTGTDFAPGGFSGASAEDVARLASVAAGRINIVAASEIRDARHALAMLDAGASRILTSAAPQVLGGL